MYKYIYSKIHWVFYIYKSFIFINEKLPHARTPYLHPPFFDQLTRPFPMNYLNIIDLFKTVLRFVSPKIGFILFCLEIWPTMM